MVSESRQDSNTGIHTHTHTVCDGKTGTPTPKFVYYEVIKKELNRRLMYECRCDERLKSKVEGSIVLCFFLECAFIITDTTKVSRKEGKWCRCYERRRSKT